MNNRTRMLIAGGIVQLLFACGNELGPRSKPPDAGTDGASASPSCFYPFSLPDGTEPAPLAGCACGASADEVAAYCVRRPSSPPGGIGSWAAVICHEGMWAQAFDGPCGGGTVSVQQCSERGGEVVTVSGPDALLGGCPSGYHWLRAVESGGDCCKPIVARLAECVAAGYKAFGDPGDGSLLDAGECPNGKRLRAFISPKDYDEGGLCCEQ